MAMTDDFLDEIENYAIAHVGLDARDARELCRSIWQGERFNLPIAKTDAGRSEQFRLEAALAAAIAPMLPDAVEAQPTAATAPKQEPEEKPDLSVETRRFLFQQRAGPRLNAFASALAETTATVEEATTTIAVALANLPPEATAGPSAKAWWRQPEFQGGGMGGSIDFAPSKTEVAKAGWAKAFAATGRA